MGTVVQRFTPVYSCLSSLAHLYSYNPIASPPPLSMKLALHQLMKLALHQLVMKLALHQLVMKLTPTDEAYTNW
jgi:hypothetical protein